MTFQSEWLQKQDYLQMTVFCIGPYTHNRTVTYYSRTYIIWNYGNLHGVWNSIHGNVTPCPSQDQGHQLKTYSLKGHILEDVKEAKYLGSYTLQRSHMEHPHL